MSLSLDCSTAELNYSRSMVPLLKAGAAGITGNVAGLASAFAEIVDAYRSVAPKNETPEQAACRFWRSAFVLAMTETIVQNRWARMADDEAIQTAIGNCLKSIFSPPDPAECTIEHLEEPKTFPLYTKLREIFPHFVETIEEGTLMGDDAMRQELDRRIDQAVVRIWVEEPSGKFQDAVERLGGPVQEGNRRRLAWKKHAGWLYDEVCRKPLPLQDDPAVTLDKVYTPLRFASHELIAQTAGERPAELVRKQDRERVIHVGWMEDALNGWLADEGKTGFLRVVAGGPGCGKTSFARRFALKIAEAGVWNVCFTEMKRMRFDGDLAANLAQHHAKTGYDTRLGGDPLEWQRTDRRPLLLVFDGLDELVRDDSAAVDTTESLVKKANGLAADLAREGLRVKCLVLGRPAAAVPAFQTGVVSSKAREPLAVGSSARGAGLLIAVCIRSPQPNRTVRFGCLCAIGSSFSRGDRRVSRLHIARGSLP